MKETPRTMLDSPIFLIQKISLQWNKDCRGGKGAVLRNNYPKAAQLPNDYFSHYPYGVPSHYIGLFQNKDGIHVRRELLNRNEWTEDGIIEFAPFELSVQNGKTKVITYITEGVRSGTNMIRHSINMCHCMNLHLN